ncbi:hypothetical protein [Pauljensenia hongkongensis]|jgi:hypothetical protein|uniref:Uncharacterized protein n=1 Tax=Pauljensenia hongkongensis TaxID=178339 RepID=A0A1D8B3T6_9ACTO|nr:hypothetical protein [Pauljensenia hongkongensis]AOS47805.1 hypothetical protein BH719_08085 [Pauljensenia hongkongensis]EFW09300.1 cyclase [Actinomyces sp. oral taxon 178 str. F0338]
MADKIKINVDALRGDANEWEHQASQIEPVSGHIPVIGPLRSAAFDPVVGACKAATEIVEVLNSLSLAAVAEFRQIADDLRLVADAYEAQEVEIGQHVKDAY